MSKRRKNAQTEIKCRPTTAAFDLRIKVDEAERLLLQGVSIKLLVHFKGVSPTLGAAQAPLSYFIENLRSGHPEGDPTIHEKAVVQLFVPGYAESSHAIQRMRSRIHNPNDDPVAVDDGDDLLPQYQLEVLVQEQSSP